MSERRQSQCSNIPVSVFIFSFAYFIVIFFIMKTLSAATPRRLESKKKITSKGRRCTHGGKPVLKSAQDPLVVPASPSAGARPETSRRTRSLGPLLQPLHLPGLARGEGDGRSQSEDQGYLLSRRPGSQEHWVSKINRKLEPPKLEEVDTHIAEHLSLSGPDRLRKGCENCELPEEKPHLYRLPSLSLK